MTKLQNPVDDRVVEVGLGDNHAFIAGSIFRGSWS